MSSICLCCVRSKFERQHTIHFPLRACVCRCLCRHHAHNIRTSYTRFYAIQCVLLCFHVSFFRSLARVVCSNRLYLNDFMLNIHTSICHAVCVLGNILHNRPYFPAGCRCCWFYCCCHSFPFLPHNNIFSHFFYLLQCCFIGSLCTCARDNIDKSDPNFCTTPTHICFPGNEHT